jgi:hypothetical protein
MNIRVKDEIINKIKKSKKSKKSKIFSNKSCLMKIKQCSQTCFLKEIHENTLKVTIRFVQFFNRNTKNS